MSETRCFLHQCLPTEWDYPGRGEQKTLYFGQAHHRQAARILIGDVFICYVTRVNKFVGVAQILGRCDDHPNPFPHYPIQFRTEMLIGLSSDTAIDAFGGVTAEGQPDLHRRPGWNARLRRDMGLLTPPLSELILHALKLAGSRP